MPTLKQKQTAIKTLENIGNPNPPKTKGQILNEVGYSDGIQKNPKEVYDTAGYKEAQDKLLKDNKIDFSNRLKKLGNIFWDKDKRASISANQEISKMLGEYKQQEGKVIALFDKIGGLE